MIEKIKANKKKIYSFLLSLGITGIFFVASNLLGNYLAEAIWMSVFLLLTLFLSIFMLFAGFSVLKALFFVAAELSLLIFLAQSYCQTSLNSEQGNNALKSLLAIGFLYITFSFFKSLHETLKKYYKKIEDEPWKKEKIISVSLFLIFIFLVITQIYLVINPIVSNLCVFK